MVRIVKLFILYSLLFGCGEKKGSHKIDHKITRWDNGKVRTEQYFVNDSVKEGIFKKYYPTGQLEAEIEYHNNKANGQVVWYFENGRKKHVIPYRNDKRSGIGWGYYESGAIKWYQVYRLFNRIGDSGFEIDYSEKGAIKNILGAPVVDLLANRDTLNVGDTLKISFQVAVPNNSKAQLHFYESIVDSNGIDLEINHTNGIAKYQKILEEKGVVDWGGICLIKFDSKEKELKFKFVGKSVVR